MELIKIIMTNSEEVKWTGDKWDDYLYDGKYFIIKKRWRMGRNVQSRLCY